MTGGLGERRRGEALQRVKYLEQMEALVKGRFLDRNHEEAKNNPKIWEVKEDTEKARSRVGGSEKICRGGR